MEKEEIRYLNPKEKQSTKAMYEKIFPEDSREFVDYYYNWKTKDNEILIMETDEKLCQVMIHLNPYTLWINESLRKIPYIVAVATHPDYRRQGKMQRVMERALQDMEQKQIPFTFLLPADPAYYRGQGFVYFPCQARTILHKVETNLTEGLEWKKAEEKDISEMIEFSNGILKKQYHISVNRDAFYYKRLLVETAVENGGVLLLKSGERLCGILAYGVDEQVEIKELILDETNLRSKEVVKEAQSKEQTKSISGEKSDPGDILKGAYEFLCRNLQPDCDISFSSSRMMVRITSLSALVPLLKSEKSRCLRVKVTDSMINANNGCYQIETDVSGGRISDIAEEETEQELDMAELTQLLFEDIKVYLNEWV